MKLKITILILFFSITTLISQNCTDGEISLLKKLTTENITYCLKTELNKTNYLVGISCNDKIWGECNFFVFKKFANTWLLEHKSTFNNTNGNIEDLKSEEDLIYFGSELAGGSIGNGYYYFNAYNPIENKLYTLEYTWSDYNYSSHSFENIENITNQKVLNFLERKASNSEVVYKPSNELSIQDEWKLANKEVYENDSNEFNISFKYSKERSNNFTDDDIEFENKKFIVYYQFKGDITAYDKSIKKYFIVWMPYWFYDNLELIGISNDNILTFKDNYMRDGVIININMETGQLNID